MTTFEPSLSTTMRASSHDAPSMADQLPSINFGFDDLRSRMNQFTARFDAFIENGRRRVLEERNQFRMNVAEMHGTPDPCAPHHFPPVLTRPPQRTSA
jgi:kinetochore protein Spc25